MTEIDNGLVENGSEQVEKSDKTKVQMEYVILYDQTIGELEGKVKNAIGKGFKPQGGVSVSIGPHVYLFQAMIKE